MTTFGRLGDVFGKKYMFIAGGLLFVVGSAASAFAPSMNFLIACRAITALGPAMMMPATLSLITILFPPAERGLPMGLWGSLVGVAIGVGPVIGGFMITDVSWQGVFWINVPLGLAAVILAQLLLPRKRQRAKYSGLDFPGIALNAGFILALSFALVEGHDKGWTSPLILGLFAASAVLLVLFVFREMRARDPMLDLDLFRKPAFSAGILVTVTVSFGLLGVFFFMPLFIQQVWGYNPLHSGLLLLPLAGAMFVAGPFGGFLAQRVPPNRPIVAAMLLFCSGMVWLAHLSVSNNWHWLLPPFLVIGIGLGISSANINTAAMAAVPREVAGAAAGVLTTIRQLGSVLGIAVLGAVLQERTVYYLSAGSNHSRQQTPNFQNVAFTHALNDTFLVCSGVLLLGALAAVLVRHSPEVARQVGHAGAAS
jgi:EmrB/QacA subfamily drug resistance transporter